MGTNKPRKFESKFPKTGCSPTNQLITNIVINVHGPKSQRCQSSCMNHSHIVSIHICTYLYVYIYIYIFYYIVWNIDIVTAVN